jgi:hypothetical protein
MILRLFVYLCCAFVSSQVFAFTCYLTLVKDNCWTNYSVKVEVLDADKNKPLVQVEVPKGQSWVRQSFVCQPAQKLVYQATYEPIFWQSEKGKINRSLRYWVLPKTVSEEESAWDIPVCFSKDFAAVPLPPDAVGNCQCNFANIPEIKPQPR